MTTATPSKGTTSNAKADSDMFAAMVEAAKVDDAPTKSRIVPWEGEIPPSILALVTAANTDGKRRTLPVSDVETYEKAKSVITAAAHSLNRGVTTRAVYVKDKDGNDTEKLEALRFTVGEKRGVKPAENGKSAEK